MKELSIEEKAKACEEAYKRVAIRFGSNVADEIFPEFKESEDERIRKNCIHFLDLQKSHHASTVEIEECIAWLEKQKEFVSADFDDVWETADCDELTAPLEKYSKDAIKKMCHAWYDKGIELERRNWLEKQGEQETDEWKEGNIIRHGGILALVIKGRRAMKSNGELFTVQYPNEWVKAVPNEIERFLNELEKKIEQKTTWTEEDENMLNDILMCGEHHCYLDTANIAWLKSIKDRYAFS